MNRKKLLYYNAIVTYWLRKDHIILTWCQWSRNLNIKFFFASNQIFDIFYPKILHALFLAFDFSYTDSDIIFYILVLAIFREKILFVLENQSQAFCFIAGLQKKITYRLALFLFGDGRIRDALQKKATKRAISKVRREKTG